MTYNCKLLLASKSPRRKIIAAQLFSGLECLEGLEFEEPSESDFECPKTYLLACLRAKISQIPKSVIRSHAKEMILIADTTVVQGSRLFGKAASPAEARAFIRAFSGKQHEVWTGFYFGKVEDMRVVEQDESLIHLECSRVSFYRLKVTEIQSYVRLGEWRGKAGAYAFQGRALPFVSEIDGSYSNILGLGLEALRKKAEALELC